MRNPKNQKIIGGLLTATVAGFMALAIMPEVRCETGDCAKKMGAICWDGDQLLYGFVFKPYFDG